MFQGERKEGEVRGAPSPSPQSNCGGSTHSVLKYWDLMAFLSEESILSIVFSTENTVTG